MGQITLALEVSLHMSASTKPHGDPQTTERRNGSTIFASGGSSGGHGGDVRLLRGANVSSDHHLVMTAVRLRLKKYTDANNNTQTRYNEGLLRNKDTQTAFQINLSNRFQLLQGLIDDSETDLETQWEESKKLWRDTCEEVLGKKKAQHKEWISSDTIQRLETRKERKTALNTRRRLFKN